MDDWDVLDDWSETDAWDSSDDWYAADEFEHDLLGDDGHDDEGDEDDGFDEDLDDAFGGGLAAGDTTAPEEQEQAVFNAWDVGTAAAIAGWLLDRQAEQIVAGVRAAAARAPEHPAQDRRTPGQPPVSGPPIDWDAAPLQVGERLERSRLAVTIAVRLGANRPLGLDAVPVVAAGPVPGRPGVDRSALSFSVAVTRIVPDLPVWVMFDDRPGGFRAAELRSGFADEGPAGRAYRFVASPWEAVEAVEWGLARYGLRVDDFRWAGGF